MSTFKNNKNKVIALSAIALMFIAILVIILILLSGNTTSAEEKDIANETPETSKIQTEATTAEQEEIPETETTPPETTAPASTETTPVSTLETEITTIPRRTEPPRTEPKTIEEVVTLAPVSTLSEEVLEIMEEHNIDIVETKPIVQTTPPLAEQRSSDSTTYIDGQKHVWDPVLGWLPDYGPGTVIIMDVEDKGDRPQYEGGW